jgi:hypothetical protein
VFAKSAEAVAYVKRKVTDILHAARVVISVLCDSLKDPQTKKRLNRSEAGSWLESIWRLGASMNEAQIEEIIALKDSKKP